MSKLWPVVLAAVVVALAGCTAPAPVAPDGPTAPPRPTRAPEAEIVESGPDGIVGTGTFTSATAQVTGGVVVKKRGASYTLYLSDFAVDDTSQLTLAVSRDAIPVDGCVSDRYQLAFDPRGQLQPDGGFPLFVRPAAVDPGYLKTIVIAEYPSGPRVGGVCYEPTVAVAPLQWSLADPFPGLGAVEDAGSTPGATGLSSSEGDVVVEYRTAAGDVFSAIAARFGINETQLMYLNPERPGIYKDRAAYADEVLNLSRDHR